MQKINIAIATVLIALASWLIGGSTAPKLGSTSRAQASCNVRVSTRAVIGNQLSSTILSAHPNRAWARISQPLNATNTVALSFDEGASAVFGSGVELSNATTTVALTGVDFGINTPFAYNGAVTGLTSTGSTTILVTECIF